MNTESIGTFAGQVWQALSEAGTLGVKQIKKATKLKDKEVFAALGWLARENKVVIANDPEDAKEYVITLL